MHSDQYRLIAGHPLRNVYRNMVQDRRDLPSVSEVKAAIAEALPNADEKLQDAIFTDVQKLARVAQERGRGEWFDLRGQADLKVLAVLEAQVAAEQLVPDSVGTGADADALVPEEPLDAAAAAVSIMEGDDPTAKGARAVQEQLKAAELEANRVRQMGGTA